LVEVNTTLGRMVVALFNETPVHRDNFMRLVRERAYDSTVFYRVIPGFLVQGGRHGDDQDPSGQGPVQGLAPEVHPRAHHVKGALSAVPLNDTTAGGGGSDPTRFFFALGREWDRQALERFTIPDPTNRSRPPVDAAAIEGYLARGGLPHLDGLCSVFGEVVEGLDVLDRIAELPCDQQDRPLNDVRIWMRILP
jgi:peptidyl-prolyl cis-trans isomerase B (cyclophilin B)